MLRSFNDEVFGSGVGAVAPWLRGGPAQRSWAYQNDKQRWNFVPFIDARKPSGMTYRDEAGSEHSLRLWRGVRELPQRGKGRIPGLLAFEGRAKLVRTKKIRTPSFRDADLGRTLQRGGNLGVDIVHSLGFGSGITVLGLLRIPHVFGSSQCLQGPECSSSPTSGTQPPRQRGFVSGNFKLTGDGTTD